MHTIKVLLINKTHTKKQAVDLQKILFRNSMLFYYYYYYSTVWQLQTVSSILMPSNIMTDRILRQNSYSTFLIHDKKKYFNGFISRMQRKIHDISVFLEIYRAFGIKQEQELCKNSSLCQLDGKTNLQNRHT